MIHAVACSCGSMISGKREHLVMIAAFWLESGSAGSPSLRHEATVDLPYEEGAAAA